MEAVKSVVAQFCAEHDCELFTKDLRSQLESKIIGVIKKDFDDANPLEKLEMEMNTHAECSLNENHEIVVDVTIPKVRKPEMIQVNFKVT